MQILLGILFKSETSYDDMMDSLDHYQNYVPSVSCEKDIPDTGRLEDNHFLTHLLEVIIFLLLKQEEYSVHIRTRETQTEWHFAHGRRLACQSMLYGG